MSEYAAIRISTLKGNLTVPFDVYVRVSERYILYCRAQEAIEGPRLNRLRTKKAKHVYIDKHDLNKYVEYISERINEALDPNTDISLDRRTGIILGAVQAAAEDLIDNLDDPIRYKVSTENAQKLMKFMQREPDAMKSFLAHENIEHNIVHHGIHVAAIAFELAKHLGYVEDQPMRIPVMLNACFIHDLEHNYNNIDVSLPAEELSDAEKAIYRNHGLAGEARIREFKFYDNLVRDIILVHDTQSDNMLSEADKVKRSSSPLVQVAATANVYDYYVNKHNLEPKAALKKMLIEEVGALPLSCLKGLQDVLKAKGIV